MNYENFNKFASLWFTIVRPVHYYLYFKMAAVYNHINRVVVFDRVNNTIVIWRRIFLHTAPASTLCIVSRLVIIQQNTSFLLLKKWCIIVNGYWSFYEHNKPPAITIREVFVCVIRWNLFSYDIIGVPRTYGLLSLLSLSKADRPTRMCTGLHNTLARLPVLLLTIVIKSNYLTVGDIKSMTTFSRNYPQSKNIL